ncbi:hypothetical protein [Leptolyngbya sp. FACHB-261]|uniref:hypothetical protein n=1 Tax=Leptolyngbya sp. FACHB-261 TaxID=2692806 RepID=UPI001F54D6E0|nr:hypothetical protein [Leptolyngbya sp. FACHB-261]
MLYPIEGNRWILTLTGVGRDYPPNDEAGFLSFARSLRSPMLYEAIKEAQALSPIYCYRCTDNRLRHYERVPSWPNELVVLGDAVCAFNPIYGQGMTAAAQAALTLGQCLRQQLPPSGDSPIGQTQVFQKRLAKVNATPWLLATGEDLRWPTTEGDQLAMSHRLLQWYVDRVRLLSHQNPEALREFLEVLHMVKPPTTLFQPAFILSVLKQAAIG